MNKIYEATSTDAIEKLLDMLEDITFLNFFSPTCGPCLMLEPVLEEMVEKKMINLIRVNVFDYPDLAEKYNVTSWPTNFIYKNKKKIQKNIGFKPIEEWEKLLKTI